MKKIALITIILLIIGLAFSCEDFFLDSEPIGHLNEYDPEYEGDYEDDEEFNPVGTALSDNFAQFGAVTITEDSYLAPREVSADTISVGGNIQVESGATLTVYAGVTLDMGGNMLGVDGCLEVLGTDADRVKFTSSSEWQGITVNSTGTANINGAVIEGYDSSSGFAMKITGDDVTLTNSRIHQPGNSVGVRIDDPLDQSVHTFENNIFVFLSDSNQSNDPCIDIDCYGSNTFELNIKYNTLIGKGNSQWAIYSNESNSSTYQIDHNIIANDVDSYIAGIYIQNTQPVVTVTYNVFDAHDGDLLVDSSGGGADTNTYNLEMSSWDNSTIFENFDSNNYKLAHTSTYPSLSQANDISDLEGCLTNGHANEVGAYGNGGYPPEWNE